jgi:hypothetical protein
MKKINQYIWWLKMKLKKLWPNKKSVIVLFKIMQNLSLMILLILFLKVKTIKLEFQWSIRHQLARNNLIK